MATDVEIVLGAFFLVAAAFHACLVVLVLAGSPRPSSWWLILLLLALSGGSAFARAWWAFSPAAGEGGAFHRVSVDLEWPLSFVVLAIAWLAAGRRFPRRIAIPGATIVVLVWLLVIFRKDLIYGEAPPGFPVETDWRAFVTDRLRYYVTMGIALAVLGLSWARAPWSHAGAGVLMLAFAFGPLQAAPDIVLRALEDRPGTAYAWASRAVQFFGPIALVSICVGLVLAGGRRDRAAGLVLGAGLLAALATGAILASYHRAGAGPLPGFGEIGYLVVRPALLAYVLVRFGVGGGPVEVPAKLVVATVALVAATVFLPAEEFARRTAPVAPDLALPVGIAAGLVASFATFAALVHSMRRAPTAATPLLAGRYRIIRTLGSGASGSTFECWDEKERRRVAVKAIATSGDGRLRELGLREAYLHAQVKDPHVIEVFEVHVLDREVLIAMDLAEGGPLAKRIDAHPEGLPPEEARRILADVLLGLSALHAAGIAHGDVKPSNVLFHGSGRAVLADLGIAKDAASRTLTGLAGAGTPAYMAPERLLGDPPGPQGDVYATGVLLHECLAGRPPRRAWTSSGVEIVDDVPSTFPAWAQAYVAQATARSPAARPQDASAALAILGGLSAVPEK